MHVSRNGDHENDGKQIANASGKDERGQEMDERSQSSNEEADEREQGHGACHAFRAHSTLKGDGYSSQELQCN
jgi:hypothetical protein